MLPPIANSRISIFVLVALGAACSDYELENIDYPKFIDTAILTPYVAPEDTEWPTVYDTAALQRCDGEEDLAQSVAMDTSCENDIVTGSIDSVLEWEMTEFEDEPNSAHVVMAPVVGQLTDDNGDGVIDSLDTPDIVIVTDDDGADSTPAGFIRIISGDGSSVKTLDHWSTPDGPLAPYRYSNLALGDLNGDGEPEIAVVLLPHNDSSTGAHEDAPIFPSAPGSSFTEGDEGGAGCTVGVFRPDGELVWQNLTSQIECGGHAPAIADLEADGFPEVIVGSHVYEGMTGDLRFQHTHGQGRFYFQPEIGMISAVADVDMDGTQEILAGGVIIAPDGTIECENEFNSDGFNGVADLDGDGFGEVLVVGNGEARIYEHDCVPDITFQLEGGGNGGPPTIADYDTDGAPEIGIADAHTYTVYETNGDVLWSHEVDDESSAATGSVVFDFEGDGRPEVVYADETRLWIFAGADGDVRLSDTRHASRTLHEYPTIADVDGDGSSEIIVPNGGGHMGEGRNGIYVLGAEEGTWLMSRHVWNQHAYSLTNIEDDLSVPVEPEVNWLQHNTFRSGDPQPMPSWLAPDAVPLAEVCYTDCPQNRVTVYVGLGNEGASAIRNNVPISVYTDPDDPTLLTTFWTGSLVDAGRVSEVFELELDADDVIDGWLKIVVDDSDGTEYVTDECVEDNNDMVLWEVSCG
jgi:hypothetical protein